MFNDAMPCYAMERRRASERASERASAARHSLQHIANHCHESPCNDIHWHVLLYTYRSYILPCIAIHCHTVPYFAILCHLFPHIAAHLHSTRFPFICQPGFWLSMEWMSFRGVKGVYIELRRSGVGRSPRFGVGRSPTCILHLHLHLHLHTYITYINEH